MRFTRLGKRFVAADQVPSPIARRLTSIAEMLRVSCGIERTGKAAGSVRRLFISSTLLHRRSAALPSTRRIGQTPISTFCGSTARSHCGALTLSISGATPTSCSSTRITLGSHSRRTTPANDSLSALPTKTCSICRMSIVGVAIIQRPTRSFCELAWHKQNPRRRQVDF